MISRRRGRSRSCSSWTVSRMERGIVQMNNPRYFGLFNPGANFPSQCADRIASAFNPQLASSASSPVPVALEAHVIRAVAHRAGFGRRGERSFRDRRIGSELHRARVRLTAAHPRFAQEGARAFPGPPTFYTSRDCHIAWLKIAHQAGVGRGCAAAHRHRRRGTHGSAGARAGDRRGSHGRGRADHDRRDRGHHRQRHDRSSACLRGYREARTALVPRRCGLGRSSYRLRSNARAPRRHRARRLGHDRCPQVARDHHGLRDVHHRSRGAVVGGLSRLHEFHALERRGGRSIPQQRAVVAALSRAAAVSRRWPRRAGRASARTSSAASR